MAERQIREIKVVIDTQGDKSLKTIADGFGRMNRSIQQTNGILGGFQSALRSVQVLAGGFVGFQMVKEVVGIADAMQKLNDRLVLSEGSFSAARVTLGEITNVANETKTGITDIATVYSRLNLALRETGISSQGLIELTKTLQNTFRLSGSTAAEATAATIQLAQGLASGQLRGQELRSVLEQNAEIGGILAKKLGIARGQLIKFAEKEGGISAATVMQALAEAMDDVNGRATKLQPTVGEALSTAFNNLKIKIFDVNTELGLTATAVKGIELASDNLGKVTLALGAAVLGWKAYSSWAAIATGATATFMAVAGSAFTGVLVKAGIVLAGFLATGAGVVLGITALAGGIAVAAASSDTFRDSIAESATALKAFLKSGLAGDSFEDAFRKADAAAAGLNNTAQIFVYETPEIVKSFYNIGKESANGYGTVLKLDNALKDFVETGKNASLENLKYEDALKRINAQWMKDKDIGKYNEALKKIEIKKLNEDFLKGEMTVKEYQKKLNEINFGKGISSLKAFRGELSALNAEFALEVSQGNVTNYSSALEKVKMDKLNRDLREGRTNFLEVNKAMRDHSINEYNRSLAEGTMSLEAWRNNTAKERLAQLNEEFRAGTLDIAAYHRGVTDSARELQPGSAFFTGTQDYINSVGTISRNVAQAVTMTFGHLEDSMVEFTKNGKFQFRKFAEAVLEDLNRIIIRSMVIRPLAEGIIGGFAGGGQGQTAQQSYAGAAERQAAKGAAFDGSRANFFATGGVVNGATPFTYSGGKSGVMGEAGPEAILPLKRDRSGNLGVAASTAPVIVNITNQSGGEVEQTERQGPNGERILDILITQKVKESFASGAMDKTMSQAYGLRRKGV